MKYFVSYFYFRTKEDYGVGCIVIDINAPLDTEEKINALIAKLSEIKQVSQLTILNWKRLEASE